MARQKIYQESIRRQSMSWWTKKMKEEDHPFTEYFCRVFDPDWTPSGSRYYYKLEYDQEGSPDKLRRFWKEGDGGSLYCGTYKILYTTERYGKHYVIIQRIENETFDDIRYIGDAETTDEIGDSFVAEYYPTGWGRIELNTTTQETLKSVSDEYVKTL